MQLKPSDFFIGIMDFFAVLLPGILVTYFFLGWEDSVFNDVIFPSLSSSAIKWVAFFIIAYILGHLLHHLGSLPDKYFYDAIYVKHKRKNNEEKLLQITRKIIKEKLGKNSDMTSAFSYASSYIKINSSVVKSEIDRSGADSKFFRSLLLSTFIILIHFAIYKIYIALIIAFALFIFSLFRYCNLRWKNSQLVYEYFILLHAQNELHREDN